MSDQAVTECGDHRVVSFSCESGHVEGLTQEKIAGLRNGGFPCLPTGQTGSSMGVIRSYGMAYFDPLRSPSKPVTASREYSGLSFMNEQTGECHDPTPHHCHCSDICTAGITGAWRFPVTGERQAATNPIMPKPLNGALAGRFVVWHNLCSVNACQKTHQGGVALASAWCEQIWQWCGHRIVPSTK